MIGARHKNARTTPAVRAEIAASSETAAALAVHYSITEQTVYKWKKRNVFTDRSHTAHRLQTRLNPAQEAVVVELRKMLLPPPDDLLAVTHEFINPDVWRSGLDRCLLRHGVGNLGDLRPARAKQAHKPFKGYESGFVHIIVKYLPQMPGQSKRRDLFVAIDQATRWMFVQIKNNKSEASAQAFLNALGKASSIRISRIHTDNGKEFIDRLFASRQRQPSGSHEFDRLCNALGIEPRLTKTRMLQTNGMVERSNGRVEDILKMHRFDSQDDLDTMMLRYVALYTHQLPRSALKGKTQIQVMKQWHSMHSHLFNKRPHDRPGCDSCSFPSHSYIPTLND